jgi:hypothetical protein
MNEVIAFLAVEKSSCSTKFRGFLVSEILRIDWRRVITSGFPNDMYGGLLLST